MGSQDRKIGCALAVFKASRIYAPFSYLSPKYSQVLMAVDLKDEHKERRAPFLQLKPQTLDMLSAKNKHPGIIFLGTDEVWVLSSSIETSSQ